MADIWQELKELREDFAILRESYVRTQEKMDNIQVRLENCEYHIEQLEKAQAGMITTKWIISAAAVLSACVLILETFLKIVR